MKMTVRTSCSTTGISSASMPFFANVISLLGMLLPLRRRDALLRPVWRQHHRRLAGQADGEYCAGADDASHINRATMQVDESLAYRQSQALASVLGGIFYIRLTEPVKNIG